VGWEVVAGPLLHPEVDAVAVGRYRLRRHRLSRVPAWSSPARASRGNTIRLTRIEGAWPRADPTAGSASLSILPGTNYGGRVTLVSRQTALNSVVCPICYGGIEIDRNQPSFSCLCGCRYEGLTAEGKTWPILVDFNSSVLKLDELLRTSGASLVHRRRPQRIVRLLRRLIHPYNHTAQAVVGSLCRDAKELRPRPRILVVGGGAIGDGTEELYASQDIDVYAFDIYASDFVQLVADAHRLPWPSEFFDGVVIQAVLEHVLDPAQVVSEIERVLVSRGYVYSDTPFMQQVHEGPYDFTRFTESGHRWLYRRFSAEASGAVAGAGTTLLWSLDYLAQALTGCQLVGQLTRLAFWWLARLDHLIRSDRRTDGASSVFFYGRKTDYEMTPAEIIDYYHRGSPWGRMSRVP
jgi:SAM-dependent methyltransferase